MKILKLMTCNPKTICADSSIAEAAKLMKRVNTGVLPVVKDGKVIGMITDRDITIRSVAEGDNPHETLVSDVMTNSAIFCYDDENIHKAGKAMMAEKVGRLPVISRKNLNLAGIVSLADIIVQCGGKRMVSGKSLKLGTRLGLPAIFALAAWGAYSNRDKIVRQFTCETKQKNAA